MVERLSIVGSSPNTSEVAGVLDFSAAVSIAGYLLFESADFSLTITFLQPHCSFLPWT